MSLRSRLPIPPFVRRMRRAWLRRAGRLGDLEFRLDQIEEIRSVYFSAGPKRGGPWDRYREAHLVLPDWFRRDLDPFGEAYAQQQQRLWAAIVGSERAYLPEIDEKEHDWSHSDPIRTPGYLCRRDEAAIDNAADHVLAMGMILRHSGLVAGDRALEYGPGFGQTALTFARMGVNVDTVDISAVFCDFVTRQAAHFDVPLQAFHGEFGMHPRPGVRYRLIWFYESFHHCVDFLRVVPKLAEMLDQGGRIILAGEPIAETECPAIPYPWGVRLHSEVAAVMRQQRWFELGFTEPFLFDLFARSGLRGRRIDCPPSLFGRLHIFERASDTGRNIPPSAR